MAIFEIEGPDGAIYEVDAPDEQSAIAGFQQAMGAPRVDPATNQPAGVPEYSPPGVEGYDPQTGEVTRDPRSRLASAAHGAADVATFGFGDELASYLGSAITGDPREQVLSEIRGMQSQAQADNPWSYMGGQVAGGIAQGAGLVAGGLSPAAHAINAGWRLPGVMAASGVEGGILGALHGAGAGETADDRLSGAKSGAMVGGVLGAAAPAVVQGVSNAARRVVSPFRAPPERIAAANLLQQEGIPVTAGQRTGSNWLRYRESELGGARAADIMDDQARAFTDAAMRRAGGSGLADGDNLRALQSTLSQGFDDISARNALTLDTPMARDILGTLNEYNAVLPTEQKAILGNIASDVVERMKAGGGKLSGKDYQTIRSRLTTRAHNARGSDNELAAAYRGLRDALDRGMERSINPGDAGKWGELRRQWGNLKVLERAATGGGEDAALGMISPARLRMAASSGNQGAYARGQGDFADLAKAGQAVMTPLPNSGTAQRMAAQGIAAAIMGGVGGAGAGPWGLAAGLAGPAAAGRALMSGPVQRYLGNQAATGAMDPMRQAIINSLLTGNTSAFAHRLPSP